MRTLALVVTLAWTASAAAADVEILNMPLPAPYARATPPEQLVAQQRAGEVGRLRALIARRVERPQQRKALEAAIERTEAEVASLERIIANYEQISRPLYSDPFLVTLERMRLARLDAVHRLDLLRTKQQGLSENFHTLRRLEELQRP